MFTRIRTVAVIGLSDNPERPSYQVASYLQSKGYRIIPVNPHLSHILGEQAYPDLAHIPPTIRIDVVDIFRKSDLVLPHVIEAVLRGDIWMIWMQEGIENDEAARYAEENGLTVFMNMCMMKSHKSVTPAPGKTNDRQTS